MRVFSRLCQAQAMELWDAEMEAMRAESREAVATGLPVINSILGKDDPLPADPLERVHRQREKYRAITIPVDEAVERDIAGVRCRVIVPPGRVNAVYLHFHGGGMIIGAPEMNDIPNRDLAMRHHVTVVSADYRLAPEHPYPAGVDDGLAVAAWLLDHGQAEFGSSRLLVGGESAGGYMSAAVLLRIRDELDAVQRVVGVNLIFGVYDWGRGPSQRGLRASDGPDMLDPEGISFFADCYLPGRTDDERRSPAISPAFADLHGLPPALMTVGTADHLVDDTLMLAGRWAAAGNQVDLFVAPDMPHGFMAVPCRLTKLWARRADEWFAARLGS
jgi:acetyl esterase